MMRNMMAVILALSLAIGLGCAGFGTGVANKLSGKEPTVEEKAKPGYDVGAIVGNILLIVTGYLGKYAQDKAAVRIPPKKEGE